MIRQAGDFLRAERVNWNASRVETKSLNDFVSYADRGSEKILIEGFKEIIPGASFLAEESGTQGDAEEYQWIIDPLDGTTNFIHGIPHYCISVALYHHQQPLWGIVYEIVHNEMYTARKGKGAFLNGKKIEVSSAAKLKDSLLTFGFPVNKFQRLDAFLQFLRKVLPVCHGARRLGAAAYDLCLVASGKAEAFVETGLNPWDVAAGALIVQEAGGKVTDFSRGNAYIFGEEILASNTHVHEEILQLLDETMR